MFKLLNATNILIAVSNINFGLPFKKPLHHKERKKV